MAGGARVILDSGALSALADGNKAVRLYLLRELGDSGDLVVPAVVVTESTTGDPRRDHSVNVQLQAAGVHSIDEPIARSAAQIRYRRGLSRAGTIDALVVATADAVPGSVILTGDPGDLTPLAQERGRSRVVAIERA